MPPSPRGRSTGAADVLTPSSDDDDFDHEDGSAPGVGEVPSDEELCLLGPTVYGFSLVCRDWGELLVVRCLSAFASPSLLR